MPAMNVLRSKMQMKYCYNCGKALVKYEERLSDHKSNLVVECPEHGEITVDAN